jgi:hypothetical protein
MNLFNPSKYKVPIVVAFAFTIFPTKVEVNSWLIALVQKYQVPALIQWALLILLSFLPAFAMAIPLYRWAIQIKQVGIANAKKPAILLVAIIVILLGFCSSRVLWWVS